VVIATYNMAQFIGDAIDSVLGQTLRDLEIHVVDDGSTDNTRAVVESYMIDPRVRYHWQPNQGQTRAKNYGVSVAIAPFVAFCDADDRWTADKLVLQLPAFDAEGRVAVVYGRSRRVAADGNSIEIQRGETHLLPSGVVTEALFVSNFIPFGTAIVRRACLSAVGAFDETYRMGIDWELWLRLSTRYEFRFVDAVVYLYRVWPGQMSNDWRGRYEHAFRIMASFLENYPKQIPRDVARLAYAGCYTQRARLRSELERDLLGALADLGRALSYSPFQVTAWKSIGRVLLNAVWPRRSLRSSQ
jgi:glycosyltransferase involved in cell wall biosynthesis